MKPAVVFVHGLYMNGWDMTLLRRRVRDCGFDVYQFSYPSMRHTAEENADDLQAFISRLPQQEVHFVCHSLGGLVIRHLFHRYPQRPGRVITLGTPHHGSEVAHFLAGFRASRWLLGKSTVRALLGGAPEWITEHEIAGICGNKRLGVDVLLRVIKGPNDGTVAVADCQFEAFKQVIILPVSHMHMLFAQSVAAQCCAFLKTGQFSVCDAA